MDMCGTCDTVTDNINECDKCGADICIVCHIAHEDDEDCLCMKCYKQQINKMTNETAFSLGYK